MVANGTEYQSYKILNHNKKITIMKVLIIFNREPYDNTDVTWNGLRLAETLRKNGQEVRIFLMNDSVDMARDTCKAPENYDQDLL